jgi:hypothetical protein
MRNSAEEESFVVNNNVCLFCDYLAQSSNGICQSCKQEYTVVRGYIETNPSSNVMEISNSTKISLSKIRLFIKEGHFIEKIK